MSEQIKKLLNELYQADPDLKQYDSEFFKIIDVMLKNKPATKFDNKFKLILKNKLMKKAKELKKQTQNVVPLWDKLVFWQTISVCAIFVLLLVAVTPLFSQLLNQQANNSGSKIIFNNGGLQINKLPDLAFGALANITSSSPQTDSSLSSSTVPVGYGGGGGNYKTESAQAKIMPPLPYNVYKYVYQGEPLQLPEGSLPVLKRIKGYGQTDYSNWLKDSNLGLIDAGQFSRLKVQHLSLLEDKDFGYMIDINPFEGNVNISENWQRPWIDYTQNIPPLTLADVPDDQTLINLANDFMAKYKIDLSNYGSPEIDNQPILYAQRNQSDSYIPNIISVRYPFMVNGQPVYEQGGTKNGVFVNINLYNKKVAGVYGLFTKNYDSSNYQVETDTQRILDLAEKGGNAYGLSFTDPQAKVIELSLGQPILSYMVFWQYENNQSNELLVPAYVFPVKEAPSDQYYYPQNIVVPIVKDILDNYYQNDLPVPTPLIEPAEVKVDKAVPAPTPEPDRPKEQQ